MPDPNRDPRRQPGLQAAPKMGGARSRGSNPVYRGAARRKRAKRKRLVSLVVFLVLAGGLFLTAYLLAGGFAPAPAPTPESVPEPVSQQQVVVPDPTPPVPVRTPTPYDEAADPPLFNFENPIPQSYSDSLELVSIGGGQQMEARAAAAFTAMSDAATEDGLYLAPVSGYRSNAQQTNNYNASIQRYLDQGMTKERAVELTEGYYAIPGTSEHEAGLAIDIGFIEDSFAQTDEYAWLQKHAAEYGFILRYPDGDDMFAITHIRWEPWHYRYVGANHAEQFIAGGYKTLEDYTAHLAGGGPAADSGATGNSATGNSAAGNSAAGNSAATAGTSPAS